MEFRLPKVCIIILHFNRITDTVECLDSVCKLDYQNFEVVVVDNTDDDGSARNIREKFPQAILIEKRENLGFAGGNNIAMRYGLSHDADYIWLLNNDTVVEKDTLDKLIASAESSPDTGLISPVISYYDDPSAIQFCGSYVDWDNMTIVHAKGTDEVKSWQGDKRSDLCLFGTALLIKKSVIHDIGFLDERYFAYWEDTDYSVRASRAGYHNDVNTEAKVLHRTPYRGQREIMESPYYFYYMTRNEYLFWMKHLRVPRRASFLRKYLASAIKESAQCRSSISNDCAEACFDGAWSAVRGVTGMWDKKVKMPSMLSKILSWHPYFWANLFEGNVSFIFSHAFKR